MNKMIALGRLSTTCLSFTVLALAAQPAHATAEYALQSGLSWYRIDNPFLFPSNSTNKLNTPDSAWSTDVRAALFLPLPTERSNLQLTAAVSQMHYGSTFSNYDNQLGSGTYNLNHDNKQFEATYTWEFSDFLRGRLYHHTDDRLYNYFGGVIPSGKLTAAPEFPHVREDSVEVAYRLTNRFDLPLTFTQQTLSYMDAGLAELYNMNSNTMQAAVRYTSGSQSTFSGGIRRSKVAFHNRTTAEILGANGVEGIDSGYTDTELFADTAWRYTENTIFIAHLGSVQRHFNQLSDHNSQLLAAELGIDWHWSSKTTFYGRIWDSPQANVEADSRLYVITRGAQLRAVWQATPKSRVSLLSSLETQKSQNFVNTAGTDGNDKLLRLGLRYDYDITRRLALRVDATREKTMSQSSGLNYQRSTVMVSLNYTFDNITGPFNFDNQQGYNRARKQIEDLR